MWFYSFYTMADGYFVARGVGPMALASVNIAMPYINFIFCLSILCSAGASAVISKYLGAGDAKRAGAAFMTNLTFLLAISLLISVFSLAFTDELAVFLGATPGLAGGVADYLWVIACFAPFFMITYFFEMMSRADGRPRLATASVVLAGLANIALDYVFVLKFGWGIKGAAWATGIAQVLPAVMLFAYFRFRSRHIAFAKFKFGAAHVLRGLKLGVGDSVTELSVGAAIFLFNRRIQEIIGENGVAGYTVIAYMTTLVVMTMFGVSQGMLPLSSYHHGRNDAETVARIRALAVKSAIVCGAAWFAVSEIFAPQIVSAFINPETERIIYADTVKAFRIFAVSFVFTGINIVLATFFLRWSARLMG
jgi:putative MATE family efflux protein